MGTFACKDSLSHPEIFIEHGYEDCEDARNKVMKERSSCEDAYAFCEEELVIRGRNFKVTSTIQCFNASMTIIINANYMDSYMEVPLVHVDPTIRVSSCPELMLS